MKDKNGNSIYVGSKVIWWDAQEDVRELDRVYVVDEIRGNEEDSIILISDEFGEAEVWGFELEVVG